MDSQSVPKKGNFDFGERLENVTVNETTQNRKWRQNNKTKQKCNWALFSLKHTLKPIQEGTKRIPASN